MKSSNRLILAGLASLGLLTACGERPPVETVQVGYRGTGMEQVYNPRLLQQVAAKNQIGSIQPPAAPVEVMARDQYPNLQVLNDLTLTEFTRVMQSMAEWVAPKDQQCTYCHVGENYADPSKYQYQVARSMLKMTRDINTNWKSHVKETGVTCHTCHRGQPVPEYVWFTDPGARKEKGSIGTNAGQNTPVTGLGLTTIAHSSLPYDPYSPFLLGDQGIRVESSTALPSGNRNSIKQSEWTYSLMVHMSNSLGVNCTYCHNTRAWASWEQSRPQRTVAWHGIRMARQMNNEYLVPLTGVFPKERLGPTGDVAKVNCQTCHQGVYKPYFGQSMAKDYPELQKRRAMPEEAAPVVEGAAAPTDAAPAAATPNAAQTPSPARAPVAVRRTTPTTVAALVRQQ
jgi:photosynthetic reaction center cytochrome c subunit